MVYIKSKFEVVSKKDSYLRYDVVENNDICLSPHNPMYLNDIISNLPEEYKGKLIIIDVLYVDECSRGQGVATSLIQRLIDRYSGNVICFLASPTEIDLTLPIDPQFDKFFDKSNKFYSRNGFVSFNDISGYESCIPYIHSSLNVFN